MRKLFYSHAKFSGFENRTLCEKITLSEERPTYIVRDKGRSNLPSNSSKIYVICTHINIVKEKEWSKYKQLVTLGKEWM